MTLTTPFFGEFAMRRLTYYGTLLY